MWFVIDRDERDDAEVARMIGRLGERARLIVLQKRELENYLLDAGAFTAFIRDKTRNTRKCEVGDVQEAIQEEGLKLGNEVIRLRLERRLLAPLILHTRSFTGSIAERLAQGINEMSARRDRVTLEEAAIREEVQKQWPEEALNHAPGSLILDSVARRFGVTFSKAKGDPERLTRFLEASVIAQEIRELLEDVARNELT